MLRSAPTTGTTTGTTTATGSAADQRRPPPYRCVDSISGRVGRSRLRGTPCPSYQDRVVWWSPDRELETWRDALQVRVGLGKGPLPRQRGERFSAGGVIIVVANDTTKPVRPRRTGGLLIERW